MNRREFVTASAAAAVGAPLFTQGAATLTGRSQGEVRAAFPRLAEEVFINAAGGTPLSTFAASGLERYMAYQRLGPGQGRGDNVAEMLGSIRSVIATLVGAEAHEIALVHCTKAGEQIALDGLDPRRHGRNIVTNDMHFSGSLHNLIGLRRAGADVRIVRNRNWDVSLDEMMAAIDDQTALVAVTLVSNVNGRIEPIQKIAQVAHAHGALVYADIIQGAGVMPLDLRALEVDFAACNAYKWLFGVHGAGFLYVREKHQGSVLPDRLFPGHVAYSYPPWVTQPERGRGDFIYREPTDASRYEPGHVSYLGYSALFEALRFIDRIGVATMLEHSVRLAQRLRDRLDPDRYTCISPHVDRSPIITFLAHDAGDMERRLRAARVVVTLAGNRLRVSPAVYNTEEDIDVLVAALNADR